MTQILFLVTRSHPFRTIRHWAEKSEERIKEFEEYYGIDANNPVYKFSNGVLVTMNQDEIKIWKDYQEGIAPSIKEMDNTTLESFIKSLESTIFEAKAKHQRAAQEQKEREIKARGGILPVPSRNNGTAQTPIQRAEKEKKTKKERLASALSMFMDDSPEDVLKEYQKEQREKISEKKIAERKEHESEAFAARKVIEGGECAFSPTGKHELKEVNANGDKACAWCQERES